MPTATLPRPPLPFTLVATAVAAWYYLSLPARVTSHSNVAMRAFRIGSRNV